MADKKKGPPSPTSKARISPVVEAGFCYLTKEDPTYGGYSAEAMFNTTEEAMAFVTSQGLDKDFPVLVEQYKKDLANDPMALAKLKKIALEDLVTPEMRKDESGKKVPTGRYKLSFSMKAKGFKVNCVGTEKGPDGKLLPYEGIIGRGDKIRLNYEMRVWVTGTGQGVSLRVLSAQLVEKAPYEGTGGGNYAADFDDGFTAPPKTEGPKAALPGPAESAMSDDDIPF